MLGLFLAAPFVLIVCIGVFASMKRAVKSAQRRHREFEQHMANAGRRVGGGH